MFCELLHDETKNAKQYIEDDCIWLTETELISDVNLLNLSTVKDVVELYIMLFKMGIDIFTDDFWQIVPYMPSKQLSEIRDNVRALAILTNAEDVDVDRYKIWNFCYGYDDNEKLRYACQHLTDFCNGVKFKTLLQELGYDGYIFRETETETFCIFDCSKLSDPQREIILLADICSDMS